MPRYFLFGERVKAGTINTETGEVERDDTELGPTVEPLDGPLLVFDRDGTVQEFNRATGQLEPRRGEPLT